MTLSRPRLRPRPRLSWWMRVRRFLRLYKTPLRFRSSIIRLRHHHKHPYLTFLRLLVPFPSWSFSVPEPVSPREIVENPSLVDTRQADLIVLRAIPVWRARDTPLRSLYRLYEIMLSGDFIPMGPETEYFWYQSRERWALHRIPDPKDSDPIRYATLACLAEELAVAFNWRLSLGLRRDGKHVYREKDEDPYPPFVPERPPEWTRRVPPIDRQLMRDSLPPSVLDQEGRLLLEKGGSNEVFAKRNIVTNVGWLYTI